MARSPNFALRNAFVAATKEVLGDVSVVNREQIAEVVSAKKVQFPQWLVQYPEFRAGRGLYALPAIVEVSEAALSVPAAAVDKVEEAVSAVLENTAAVSYTESLVPQKAVGYVPFGNFADVRTIIKSKIFYPIYITGLSGNGKTMMVEQVCAVEKREFVRANITIETDEDDLIGGFRLAEGRTVWENGPVITAMERGAILLLDEVDLGSNKLMCLQPVLEGKPVYLKKINKVVTPAPGFNIIATANTKGKGSDDGRFIGTNVMNEAFLERFSVTMEQEYPAVKIETKILNNVLGNLGIEAKEFADKLVMWADVIRKSFYEGAVSEVISTRRLVHICQAYSMFGQNREKAIALCLSRFDIDTKNSFLDLYKKLDDTPTAPAVDGVQVDASDEPVTF